ncbi:MAG TPA: hypothetical protein VMU81_16700 [Acetobacteraceae bacterium]|nr:hypothetical protein [Acetobacteraceae bacterium]
MLRNVIAGGVTLTAGQRRPAASHPRTGHAEPSNLPAPPAPGTPPPAPRPRRARLNPPARPGWLRRCLTPACRRPTPPTRAALSEDDDQPFTLEAFPGLGPELCAILNTPLQDLDTDILRTLLAAFAMTLADAMPPETARTDTGALFSALWGRLAAALDEAQPAIAPVPAPATTAAPLPAEPPASPPPTRQPSPPEPADAPPGALLPPPPSPPEAPSANLTPPAATSAVALPPVAPNLPSLRAPVPHAHHPSPNRAHTYPRRTKSPVHRRHFPLSRAAPAQPLPPRYSFYAARAGPSPALLLA